MRAWVRFALPSVVLTATVLTAGWLWLEPAGQRGMTVAAAAGLLPQLVLFAFLVWVERESPAFLGAWAAGVLARLLVVGGVAALVWVREDLDPLVTLGTLAGLLVAFLLLEIGVLMGDRKPTINANEPTR